MSLNGGVANRLREWIAAWPVEPDEAMLLRVLRYLGQWRAIMLANTQLRICGETVLAGPFRGMTYVRAPAEGALMPKLLGCYESELHPHLEHLTVPTPECVVDIGCAEGYYAVGLARLLPAATVYAHDIDQGARDACEALAKSNGVGARVIVGGAFRPEDFQSFEGRRTLVIVDAEGAEVDILRPDLAPALSEMALIVETHDLHRAGALNEIYRRFRDTHEITRVDQQPKVVEFPDWMRTLTHLDQLIAVWEWRVKPTPWLVMRPRVWR